MSTETVEVPEVPETWTARHLLDLERLSAAELTALLDTAVTLKQATDGCRGKLSLLRDRTVANLFFENSTRTRTSFSLAARRLGADTIEFTASSSSLSKGETYIDTARNIEAMNVDAMVVRHPTPGTPHKLAQNVACAVINAGDGPHEHPTQGLLDIMTIREHRGDLEGLTVALVGDIAHSRTARSNLWGLQRLGAHVILCGPSTLVSRRWEEFGVEVSYSLDEILPRCDVLNLLRIQFERQSTRPFPSVHEYALLYAMNRERMERAKDDILIMAAASQRHRRCVARVVPLIANGGEVSEWVGTLTDVEDAKQAEEALRRAERLASLGTLAAGIAHEINNPIVAAWTSAEAALNVLDQPAARDMLAECLHNVIQSVLRCRDTVEGVLRFARHGEVEQRDCDLARVIRQAINELEHYAETHDQTLAWNSPAELPTIYGNEAQMQQVLVTLIRNAIEAGREGDRVEVAAIAREDSVQITVTDFGHGMTATEQLRAFDPFFTSRKERGTGLGLSIAHGIMEGHGGSIALTSEEGGGTKVTVRFPVKEATDKLDENNTRGVPE